MYATGVLTSSRYLLGKLAWICVQVWGKGMNFTEQMSWFLDALYRHEQQLALEFVGKLLT